MKFTPGALYKFQRSSPKKVGSIGDCISIFAFEDGYILNKDNSIAVGFELTPFQEETKDGEGFETIISGFSSACKNLPIGTVVQKIDIYYEDEFITPSTTNLPFFHRKTFDHLKGKKILKHRTFIFLRFSTISTTPLKSSLTLGGLFFTPSMSKISNRLEIVDELSNEFMHSMPSGLKIRRLTNEENEKIVYQYVNLTFHRETVGFETGITDLDGGIFTDVHIKSVRMYKQANDVFAWNKNNFGEKGVTSHFMWQVSHFAQFPHILNQQIEIIDDKKFRKEKNTEFTWVAQLSLGSRDTQLAGSDQEKFEEIDSELHEHDTKVVKLSYNILLWDANESIVKTRTYTIKETLSTLGIGAKEEKEKTLESFLACIPGAAGYADGCYMPLNTAVAHFNFMTQRRGDEEGILLANRHGDPIYYNPFKFRLGKQQMINQHAFVFGPTGSGKSFFNGKLIKERYYLGHTVVVIDNGGTYKNLFKALGGKYIEYDPSKPLELNPFFINKEGDIYKPEAGKIDFLINFIAKIWRGDLHRNPLSETEYATLSKCLEAYYQSLHKDDIPTLVKFYDWLPDFIEASNISPKLLDSEDLLAALTPFTYGKYKEYFNALNPIQLENEKLICFEVAAVKEHTKLYPLFMKVLFDYLLELMAMKFSKEDTKSSNRKKEKKFIDIEEGWSMLDDSSKEYIEAFFRKGRKTNTSIRIITQGIKEIENSPIADALVINAATSILLYSPNESDRKYISKLLGLSELDKEKYDSLRSREVYHDGYREVFIKEMNTSFVCRTGVSIYEHALLTSQPEERETIIELTKEKGDLVEAVIEWSEKMLKKHE